MAVTTFMKYLPKLTEVVEAKVAKCIPDAFCLVFDGWSCPTTHYLAIFASFSSNITAGHMQRLLAISPFEDGSTQDAKEHYKFISHVLNIVGKNWSNVTALVGDNCNTKKCIELLAQRPLVGCASHRFNLAVCEILDEYSDMLDKIHSLMTKLKTPTLRARLRKPISFSPKSRNVTRWSSSFDIVLRYTQLREYSPTLENGDVDALLLTTSENRRVDSVLGSLKDLETIQKKLQNNDTTIRDVRGLFDIGIDSYPCSSSKISTDLNIIHSPRFKSALVKVQLGNCTALSREERLSLEKVVVNDDIQSDSDGDEESFADRSIKRQRRSSTIESVRYTDTIYVLPTSNVCERLFSVSGHALDPRRMSLSPPI